MFTGIIQATGGLRSKTAQAQDMRLQIEAKALDLSDVALGDSIAVNGVCLTVVAMQDGAFSADVSKESLSRTTLGTLREGARVNLEKAMQLTQRLGGHIVTGHVDGIGAVIAVEPDGRSVCVRIRVPQGLKKYIAEKGSVCVDGVSLTVNRVESDIFSVNLIPHTVAHTTFEGLRPGSLCNIEIDIIARYIERMLQVDAGGINEETLKRVGFFQKKT